MLLKVSLLRKNAYELQASLSKRVVVEGHGGNIALHLGVKAKENPRQNSYVVLVT